MKNNNSITNTKGFFASSTEANIKYTGRLDMAMIYTKTPAVFAGTFTNNKVKAAPVLWDKIVLDSKSKVSCIVVNAGIANAATGDEGLKDVEEVAKYAASKFALDKTNVLVASTGVIGMRLPVDKMKKGVDNLVNNLSDDIDSGHLASKAIMTTDTIEKETSVTLNIGDKVVTISGMCKGSGMIHPNMGTMLSFITTDINISQELLQKALVEIVDDTYNMISVDGDTSTNDSCIVLANGMAQNEMITGEDENYDKFKNALFEVNSTLAKKIAMDGEGATKLMEVHVDGANTKGNAKKIAKSIVTSNLTKAAIYGEDPNWGRIICAIGNADVDIDVDAINISFESGNGNITVCKNGKELEFDTKIAKKVMSTDHIKIVCDVGSGKFNAVAYGCDLTHKYVDINASYRS